MQVVLLRLFHLILFFCQPHGESLEAFLNGYHFLVDHSLQRDVQQVEPMRTLHDEVGTIHVV